MITIDAKISEWIIGEMWRWNHLFIDRALKEWDKTIDASMCFPAFVRYSVNAQWYAMAARN